MNCSLCGLPQDTGAIGSVLPQCICHWKHTPYQGTAQKELNAGGEQVKNATYWKRQHDNLLMKLNTCAIKVSELEKKLDIRTRELIGASFYEHDYKTMMANNKPVAYLNDGFLEWNKDHKADKVVPLYTHPVKELDRELLDKTIIDQQNEIKNLRKNLDIALMIVNKPELTDEEINDAWKQSHEDGIAMQQGFTTQQHYFAHLILRKAQAK